MTNPKPLAPRKRFQNLKDEERSLLRCALAKEGLRVEDACREAERCMASLDTRQLLAQRLKMVLNLRTEIGI